MRGLTYGISMFAGGSIDSRGGPKVTEYLHPSIGHKGEVERK